VTPIQSPDLFQAFRKQMTGLQQGMLVILSVILAMSLLLIGLIFSMATNEVHFDETPYLTPIAVASSFSPPSSSSRRRARASAERGIPSSSSRESGTENEATFLLGFELDSISLERLLQKL
jgi:hypothetical protein